MYFRSDGTISSFCSQTPVNQVSAANVIDDRRMPGTFDDALTARFVIIYLLLEACLCEVGEGDFFH